MVTPVHVVDKATKLETICDRIDLVATRFEIARRDREIARLRSNPSAPADPALTPPVPDPDMSVEAWQEQLEADLAFLRHSNFGSEFMPPPERERVQQIADRYQIAGPDGGLRPILTQDEVYNLTIPKGTLTNEERGVINEHVVATVKMLEKLPYPKKLRNVPFLAGAHHEKIDGSGYPDGLKGDDLPIRAQIIGLADIFEALTAKDRPYKPGRTLQEALGILGKMMEQGQIDKTLFDLFVGQKLHLVYARDYLEPAQIDIADPDFPDLGAAQAA
ncbi:MAG: HD domain-containing phosphohydrolase [Candidatus Eisenbacteria bacterium]